MNWENKIIIVTGANHPVGKSICRLFAGANARVYAISDDEINLCDLSNSNVNVILSNGNDIDTLNAAFKNIGVAEGRIDALFCDTRFSDPGLKATDLTPDIINDAMKKTTYYAWKSALYAIPYLRKSTQGSVCFITNNSIRHQKENNILTSICATSLESITKNFASEVAADGIRMTAVAVGDGVFPEKAASCACWLASLSASYITGCMIEVNKEETRCDD